VASLDVAEPEVMLEVEVLELSRKPAAGSRHPVSHQRDLQAVASCHGRYGRCLRLVLSDLAHQNSNTIGLSALAVTVNAMKQAGLVNTWRVRGSGRATRKKPRC